MRQFSFISRILSVFFLVAVGLVAQAQSDRNLYRADQYFKIKNYPEALKYYKLAVDAGNTDEVTHYRLGFSYFQSSSIEEKVKAIPHFEKAKGKESRDIPSTLYFDMGSAYHLNGDIKEAIDAYKIYKTKIRGNKLEVTKVDKALAQARNAMFYLQAPQSTAVQPFGGNTNSEYTEYNPVVSADASVMAFTALREDSRSGNLVEKIMISYNESGSWSEPKEVNLKANGNLGTAGISPDGQQMVVFIGTGERTGNLYTVARSGNDWENPEVLSESINSRFMESTASITPDGKKMYFASNRPGGYGGFDIYVSVKDAAGNWSKPTNLGPRINTKYDEDAPFIHPDQKNLYFTSDGENSMGGRDIFKSTLTDDQWSKPYNMGYPVNTTADDNYFTLTADGRKGYFSSNRMGGKGGQDIYSMDMPEGEANIPLTMLKGRILNAETNAPIPTKIYVIDKSTDEKLDFVYNPNPKTGDYLIILPPSKNYDMVIESEEFLPYTLNINIPDQTYFYELYQMIYLRTIKQFDVKVGQEVEVKNAFYDTHQDVVADMRKAHEAQLIQSDSIDVYDLMADLIAADDAKAIDYLTELIAMSNPIDQVNFDENTNENLETAKRVYYYDESDESKFEQKEVDGNIILSLPTFYVTEEAVKQKEAKEKLADIDPALLKKSLTIYFGAGSSDLQESYHQKLDEFLKLMQENKNVYIEISGYASSDGDEETNRELSNKRAIGVLEYLNHRGIVRRRIIAKGFGETQTESLSAKEGRKVELKIVAEPN